MNKQQFLQELRNCLEGEVSGQVLYDNIAYYEEYFHEQMSLGRSEREIADELGKPSLIARTIIDASEVPSDGYYDEQIYTEKGEESFEEDDGLHMIRIKWYHKLLIAIVIVAVLLLILTIAGAILSFAAPIILIIILFYLIKRWIF